jgi:hypothetical protein
MQRIDLTPELIHGAVAIESTDTGLRPWRCRLDERPLFEDNLLERLGMAAGVRLRFRTDSRSLSVLVAPSDDPALAEQPFDLVVDGELQDAVRYVPGEQRVSFGGLAGEACVCEVWLPVTWSRPLAAIEIDDNTTLETVPDDRPKWIAYGSSITHCRQSDRPAMTWPAIVARKHGLDLTSLGLGGQCHGDPLIARQIRDMPADLITVKFGINVYGAASLGERMFASALIGLVRIIREKHPTTPMAVCSPIVSPPRESTPNAVHLTLETMRELVSDAVDRLQQTGDDHLIYVDGLKLFGPDLVEDYMPDLLHPNGPGQPTFAANISEHVIQPLGF